MNLYWADGYQEKKCTAQEAIARIKPGQRVFIGSSCGEPQHLVRALSDASRRFTDLEIIRLLSLETTPLTMIAEKTHGQSLNIRSFYLGSAKSKDLAKNKRFITPINLSAVPRLFKTRQLPIHVALIQVSFPDDFGWMSLGVSVDVTQAAAQAADMVIAQVNSKMPRILGQSFIHVNDVDIIVEHDEDLITIRDSPDSETADKIGQQIARLVDDGSTMQMSLGTTNNATLLGLSQKNDLGVHSQFFTDGMMRLVSHGVINNRKKGFNEGKSVASFAVGSSDLYEFLHDNPSVDFYPSDYVNNSRIISRHNKMVTLNVGMAIDLTGQVAADAMQSNHYSGITGILDFTRGAAWSPGGKSIIMMTSTRDKGKSSRIVPMLKDTAVVVPRGDAHYVVTEYGAVNLFGKSLQERAMALISLAHPDHREELLSQAKDEGLLEKDRTLSESLYGIYPLNLEEEIVRKDHTITIRPAKPVDERRIQEHFYSLEKSDVVSRFFHEKTSFVRKEVQGMFQIDYIKDLTILGLVGEFGFGRVIAIGEYLLDPAKNMAEVAFSVSQDFQGMGLGTTLLRKLAESARENGITGLEAYTSPSNKGMIHLFKTLPYKVSTYFDGDVFTLSCRFDAPQLNGNA